MVKKSLLIMMLLALFAPWAANAQTETVTIGTGTTTDYYTPIGTYHNYSFSEQLYTATDINKTGYILSIGFSYAGTTAKDFPVVVYMKAVDDTNLSSGWISVAETDEVFNGTLSVTGSGWATIVLDEPFDYDGTKNLLIAIDKAFVKWYSGGNWNHTSATSMVRHYCNDTNDPDPMNPSSAGTSTVSSNRPNLQLTFGTPPSCPKPTLLNVADEDITGNSATVRWTPSNENQELFDLYWSTTNTPPTDETTPLAANQTGTSYQITGLSAVTQYYVWLRGNCGSVDDPDISGGWTSAKSFTTACDAISPGYTCGFEGPNTGGTSSYPLPACWTRPSGTNTQYPYSYNYSNYAHSGSYSLYFYGNTSSTAQIAVLPEIEGGVNGKRLQFFARLASTYNTGGLSIGYMTNTDNASTFVEVMPFPLTTASYPTEAYTVDFADIEGNPTFIAIKSTSTSSASIYVDDVMLNYTPSCLPPTNLSATEITTNSAKLSWTTHTSEQAWTVYYKTTDAANYTAQAVTTNPYTLGNLAAGTNYQYYVVANCDVDDASEPSDECYFKTNCEALTITTNYEENFETNHPSSEYTPSTHYLPDCWNYINTSTGQYSHYPTVHYYTYTAYGNGNSNAYLRFYSYSYNGNNDPQDQYAILPPMENVNTLRIKLYARALNDGSTYDATFHVGVMTDPTNASTFSEIASKTPATTSYESYTIPFDGYTGNGTYIAIKMDAAAASGTSYHSVFIDDIIVEPIPGCMEPSDLAVAEEEGNPTSTSVKLQWTAGGSETNWKLQYKKASATEWIDLAETVTTNPYTLQGLDPSSTYNVRVAAWCDPTNPESVSPWSEAISFNTDCGVVSTFPWSENFNTLTAGIPNCWDNSEGTTTTESYKWNYYATGHDGAGLRFNSYNNSNNLTNFLKTPVMNLPAGKVMQLNFWYKNPAGGDFSVFISTDGGVTYTTALATNLRYQSSWAEKEIVLNDYVGTENVVIVFKGTSNYGNGDAYIYLDDVVIAEAPTCIKPSALKCDSKTAHTATLSWTNGEEGQNAWQIAYSTTSDFNPDEVTPVDVTTNPATIEGLSQSTTYYAYVRANCGSEDGMSAWSNAKVTFTTLAGNVTPTGLAVAPASITSSQATASWNAVAGNTLHQSYDIYWDLATVTSVPAEPAAPNLISGITATSQDITGLDPETSYKVWVRDNCGTDGLSAWSTAVTFSTVSACQTPDGLAESNVTNNSATITWNTYGLTDFNLRYSTDGTTWTTVENVNSPYTFPNNLTANTAYQVQVKATCADAETWSTVLNFRTECDAITITDTDTYTEDFEDPTGTDALTASDILPGCWEQAGTATYLPHIANTSSSSYGYYTHGGTQALAFAGNGYAYAILPEFSNAISELQIKFWMQTESGTNGTLKLGYITSEDNGSCNTFTEIATYDNNSGSMVQRTTYLDEVPSDAARLVFQWYYSNNWTACIDDVEVALMPSCYPVGTLAEATDIQATTAKLSWALVDDTQTAWQVCLNGDETNLIEATTHENFLLENLSPETAYSVKVRANCGDSQSEWSNEISFTTLEACPTPSNLAASNLTQNTADLTWNGESDSYNIQYRTAATIGTPIFSEDFSNGIGNWTMVDCHSSTGVHNGAFRFYYSDYPPQYLISPEISGITTDAILEFVYYNNSITYEETFKVGLSSTDNETASFSWSETLSVRDNNQHTYHATVPAGTKYMAIQLLSEDKLYLYIDNIVIANEIPVGEWQPTTPINTTESTATITGLTAGTEYEVQVQGVCNNVPGNWANATFTTMAEGNMVFTNATTDGKWGTSGNWAPAQLPVLTDEVILRANATVESGCVAEADKITFEGTPTPTLTIADGGQLITNTAVTATVQKVINAHGETTADGGWYFIASPISTAVNPSDADLITDDLGSDVTSATATYDLYYFYENPGNELEWKNYRNTTFNLYNKDGYLYANKDKVTLNFTGSINPATSSMSKTLDYTEGAELAGWNLVGNPFTFNTYVNMSYYKMNDDGSAIEPEAVSQTTTIAPCTGIMVQATATGQSITFSKDAPSSQNGNQGNLNIALAQANVRNNTVMDKAVLSFNEGSQLGKFYFGENAANIYFPQDNKEFAIVSSEGQGEMPLSFRANENGTYTLSFNAEEVTFNYLHLIDNMTGADVDLLAATSTGSVATYTFNARTTDYSSRFKLVFATGSNNDSDNFAFFSNGNWIIGNEGEATLQVIDVTGRVLSSETVNGSVSKAINASAGVYMLRLINGNDVKTQKIVVR